MAMVFQSAALLTSLTVGENVGIYLSEHQLKPPEEIARIVAEKLEVGRPQRAWKTACPTSFPAACKSGWPSPAPWSWTRN